MPKEIYPELDGIAKIIFAIDGSIAILSPSRASKPDYKSGEECIFCPPSRGSLANPVIGKDLLSEMNERGLYIMDNAFPTFSSQEKVASIDTRYMPHPGIFHDLKPAVGRHLVMIETPHHKLNPFSDSRETTEYYRNLVWGYIQMLNFLKDQGYKWGGVGKNRNGVETLKMPFFSELVRLFFPNYGVLDAGSSQPHPHSQAIGLSFVPNKLEELVKSSFEYEKFLAKDSEGDILAGCSNCLMAREYISKTLVSNKYYTVFVAEVPFGTNPYHEEIRVYPINHQSHFEAMSTEQALALADILHKTMAILGKNKDIGYNFEVRQGPWISEYDIRKSHWTFSIYPAHDRKTVKHIGFIPHLIGASIIESDTDALRQKILDGRL
ncbi:hypothetical protein HYT53_02860 [Candidatus Woesearchaeota archaeon]|nr:hypothetical protein [Candidatus Woesearchaeota archaeon]